MGEATSFALLLQILVHDVLHVGQVEVCQVDQRFLRRLVESVELGVVGFDTLDDLPGALLFLNQNLLRHHHLCDHDASQRVQDGRERALFRLLLLLLLGIGDLGFGIWDLGFQSKKRVDNKQTNTQTDKQTNKQTNKIAPQCLFEQWFEQ